MGRGRSFAAVLSIVSAVAGCGGGEATGPGGPGPAFGPHGGPVAALAPGVFAEVVIEPTRAAATPPWHRVVAYFYDGPQLAGPPVRAPEAVRFILEAPGSAPAPLELAAEPGRTAAEVARFVSSPGPLAVDSIVGSLRATLDGAEVTTTVASPR